MSKQSFRVHYVEDRERDAQAYERRLNKGDRLAVKAVSPQPGPVVTHIIDPKPDLFLVDLKLATRQDDGTVVSYGGATLSAHLREHLPDRPIVLLTRKGIWRNLEQAVRDLQSFDAVVYKSEVDRAPEVVIDRLWRMAHGFAALRSAKDRSWDSLMRLLGAEAEEEAFLSQAAPPIANHEAAKPWKVTEAARWIRDVLLTYPGIVYPPLHAATMLGITLKSFQEAEVQALLAPAAYNGVFTPEDGPWWKTRLVSQVVNVLDAAGFAGSVNRNFAKAYRKTTGRKLTPCTCIVSRKKPADCVCYVLNKPTRMEYTLRYHPDSRPSVMDAARVSFKAIRQHKVIDELFDPSSREILAEIRTPDEGAG